MSREWKPGDVALVTYYTGESDVALLQDGDPGDWCVASGVVNHKVSPPPTFRPLVVIDPEDREQVERLIVAMEQVSGEKRGGRSFDFVQASLRSLIEPDRPEEPTGLGAVVEDVDGKRYIRTADTDCRKPWSYANNYSDHDWPDVKAVRVLSEGIS